jgi:hypothetical protein
VSAHATQITQTPRPPRARVRRRGVGAALRLAVAMAFAAVATPAVALVGTHGPSITSFDTRASSVALSLGHLRYGKDSLSVATYNTAFSSTTGRLSSQFGAHALLLSESGVGVGFAAGAVTMYAVSVGERFANGVPKGATRIYGGVVPTAILGTIGGRVWVPVVLGVARSWSPKPWLTITGFAEAAPGLDFNAVVEPTAIDTATKSGDVLSEEQLRELFDKAVTWDIGFGFGWRGGVDVNAHAGDTLDIGLRFGAGNVGDKVAWSGRLTFTMRWDDIVPGVLPKQSAAPAAAPEPAVEGDAAN